MSTPLPRRYPGLKPFERSQRAVFHGRSDDIQRLTNLIIRERLTVLFAKSGIGKTSLLQAGVAPMLEQQNFVPVFLRADRTDMPLSTTFGTLLEGNTQVSGRADVPPLIEGEPALWEHLKRLEFDLNGLPATPVLMFDQFEEVFTLGHSEGSRRQFLGQLADLANESMPELIRDVLLKRVQAGGSSADVAIMRWWEQQPDIRIVLSIRSDFLHLLDDISPILPGILKSRYQLKPLGMKQAREAIEAPAKATDAVFASPAFFYNQAAIEEILQYLAGHSEDNAAINDALALRREEEVESFNLQILCQYIEEKVIAENRPAGFEVTPDFYNGKDGLKREIRDFYQKQLKSLPDLYQRRTGQALAKPLTFIDRARRLIEESLVTPIGRRCSMVDDYLTTTWEVDANFLDTLVDTRLLRKELRLNDYYFEISHDTLLPAVIASRDERRRQEKAARDREAFEAQLAEEAHKREQIEKEVHTLKEKRRLARMLIITSVSTLVVILLFGVWFLYNWVQSVRKELSQVENNVYSEQYEAALAGYDQLHQNRLKNWTLETFPPHKQLAEERTAAGRLQELYLAITTQEQNLGDSLFFADLYAEALRAYNVALDSLKEYDTLNRSLLISVSNRQRYRVDPAHISEKFQDLHQRRTSAFKSLRDRFDLHHRKYEAFLEARAWPQALRNLNAMNQLLPYDRNYLDSLRTSLGMMQNPRDYVVKEIQRVSTLSKK